MLRDKCDSQALPTLRATLRTYVAKGYVARCTLRCSQGHGIGRRVHHVRGRLADDLLPAKDEAKYMRAQEQLLACFNGDVRGPMVHYCRGPPECCNDAAESHNLSCPATERCDHVARCRSTLRSTLRAGPNGCFRRMSRAFPKLRATLRTYLAKGYVARRTLRCS